MPLTPNGEQISKNNCTVRHSGHHWANSPKQPVVFPRNQFKFILLLFAGAVQSSLNSLFRCAQNNRFNGYKKHVELVFKPVPPVVSGAVSPWRWNVLFQVFINDTLRSRFEKRRRRGAQTDVYCAGILFHVRVLKQEGRLFTYCYLQAANI